MTILNSQDQTLLVELGTEELPPKSLKKLTDSFVNAFTQEIKKLGFSFDSVIPFGAPRRLGVSLTHCQRTQADTIVEKRGPAVSVAFDEAGEPTKAALGWARGNGIDISQAERLITDKGEWLLHKATQKGQSLDSQLEGAIERALKQLPIPKPMRWGSSDVEFIRPAHTLCAMYGSEIIDIEILGIQSSNIISGHRFHGESEIRLTHADNYAETLKHQYVLADYQTRMQAIEQQLLSQSEELGLKPDYDNDLLEEISSLVEWPVVLQAKFENDFLDVPKEALIYTMKDDQKYVPLLDENNELSSTFLFVSNIESKEPQQVIEGNQKVIRPRLSDAKFFFETDKKTSLASKAEALSTILFQKELGSIAEKSTRVAQITAILGELTGTESEHVMHAKRAAVLAKADLVSNMVMEFPSVQGIMGAHYALHDGEHPSVSLAIKEQYLPRFAGDDLPTSQAGMLLSLAEKLDTLVGIFGINKIPKGDKDPFALRRSAIGILRIMLAFNVNVNLSRIISAVAELYENKLSNPLVEQQIVEFLIDRLKPFYADKGISADIVASVVECEAQQSLSDINQRIVAVSNFANSSNAESLVKANKRVANILAKNKINLDELTEINSGLFTESAEKALYGEFEKLVQTVPNLAKNNNYQEILDQLSLLKTSLDAFFDEVMIMADDERVKQNRISLVAQVRKLFLSVADISVLNF
ncbi:glycine--tRNA ligase subunit beta [Glaciecola petra]|uniref:Glycine--tRNA ligase beta subunit n=1 Tax=Glaciecola petra TaxID=3075602 RepID=A0ABU2ZQC6_9ALTE|nr:glycine--tRNA ligase subunit beta [Aestuariibacter sp. P117]MDT0594805.1 glycine--tRNA ligase subunit beta [Aestuariibacter sp. P117]